MNTTVLAITAILVIGLVQLFALYNGVDGNLTKTCFTAIGLIVGVPIGISIKKSQNENKEKDE